MQGSTLDVRMWRLKSPLALKELNITAYTHLKLCLADAIHNFKWVKIIQIFCILLIDVTFYH